MNKPLAVPVKRSRHKEYALVIMILALPIVFLLQKTPTLWALLLVNAVALTTILLSAFSVVRHADVLAHRFGEPFGSLILSLSVVLLEVGLISALMVTGDTAPTLLRDTLYSLIMLVLSGFVGVALLVGGQKFKTQHINLAGVTQYLTAIIPLVLLVLVLPATLKNNTFNHTQMVIVACLSTALYGVFLFIQTRTHQSIFIYEDEDADDEHGGHGTLSCHSHLWHAAWLLVHLLSVVLMTKINATSLESILKTVNAPVGVMGLLVALLVFSPEALGALRATLANNLQRAMNIFFGSVLATISLTIPAVITIALLTNQTIELGLAYADLTLLAGLFILCQVSFASGRTNQLDGVAHLVIFGGYVMILFN